MLTPRTVRKPVPVAGAGTRHAPGSMSKLRQVQVRRLIQGDDSDSGGEEPRSGAVDSGASAATPPVHGPEAWQIACEIAEKVVSGEGHKRATPPAPSTSPQHDAPLSPGASPASVTPMALSVLQQWGSGFATPETAASLERRAAGAHAATASGVKQWLRANDAFEPSAGRPKPRGALAGAGMPQSSVGLLLLQNTWGGFYVGALLPARFSLADGMSVLPAAGCRA